eukprot:gene11339-15204_t
MKIKRERSSSFSNEYNQDNIVYLDHEIDDTKVPSIKMESKIKMETKLVHLVKVEPPKNGLPVGYVCKACGIANDHAIYNCSRKLKKKKLDVNSNGNDNSNDVSPLSIKPKSTANTIPFNDQENKPVKVRSDSTTTLFVSGLPFTFTKEQLQDLLQQKLNDYTNEDNDLIPIQDINLIMFADNPKKCKGVAYVKIPTIEKQSYLQLNNIVIGTNPKNQQDLLLKIEENTTRLNSVKKVKKTKVKLESNEKNENNSKIQKKHCFRCGLLHDPSTCLNPRICYRCKGTDHLSSSCPMKAKKNN